jgi:hypothetical protein
MYVCSSPFYPTSNIQRIGCPPLPPPPLRLDVLLEVDGIKVSSEGIVSVLKDPELDSFHEVKCTQYTVLTTHCTHYTLDSFHEVSGLQV